MKILIAGATGLIGKELVSECQDLGIKIHYLTTRKNKLENKEDYQGFYWNPSEGIIDKAAFNGVLTIINLAGAPVSKRWTSSYKKKILNSRTQTANLICDTLKEIEHTVAHYISASGISIYPNSFTNLYLETSNQEAQTFLGEVVMAWEAAADRFSSLNIKVTKVRTGIVLSKKGGALQQMVKPIKLGLGAPLGSGEQWQSWIHLNDMARVYLYILKNQLSGVFNAVSPNPVTNKKLTHIIANYYDKPLWLPNVPQFMIKLLLGEMGSIALESQLVSSEKIVKEGFQFQYVNVENALEDLL
jgi:uncharacterized protein (TIGR01777 family)